MEMSETELLDMLKGLSAEEQAKIMNVLQKDLAFQKDEQNRIKTLHSTVQIKKWEQSNQNLNNSLSTESLTSTHSNLSSQGNSRGSSPMGKSWGKTCVACNNSLGYILNSGKRCKKCGVDVCDKCSITVSHKETKAALCPTCHSERELDAAANTWMGSGAPTHDTSEVLLGAMKKASIGDRRKMTDAGIPQRTRAPPISRRNLTLPSISTQFLIVPDESEAIATAREQSEDRFWEGSPSPRSPRPRAFTIGHHAPPSTNSPFHHRFSVSSASGRSSPRGGNLFAMHPTEAIGSPAPRKYSSSPLHDLPEEEGTKCQTTVALPVSPGVSKRGERRRSEFNGTKRVGGQRRQSEAPLPTFRLSMC